MDIRYQFVRHFMLKEPKHTFSQNTGAGLNFSCLHEGSYRRAADSANIISYITGSHCNICGGKQDAIERFYASVAHCWETKIWETPIWETIGGRYDTIEFPATSNVNFSLNLTDYFLVQGSKVIDIRIGNNGPNDPNITPEDHLKDGNFCILAEGSKSALNIGQKNVIVYCLPFPHGSGNIEGRFHISTNWLPAHNLAQIYPLFLALEAFSENRLETATVMAWTGFEISIKRLEKHHAKKLFATKLEWNNHVSKQKENGEIFWQIVLDTVLLNFNLEKISIISQSFTSCIKELNKERQFVHRGKPTNEQRQNIYKMICAAIFGSTLSNALIDLSEKRTQQKVEELQTMQGISIGYINNPPDQCIKKLGKNQD